MPGGEARLAIALHRVRGHRDDARLRRSAASARMRRVASRPSISGICTSISTRSYGRRFDRFDRLDAVGGDVGAVPHRFEHAAGRSAGSRCCPRRAGCAAGGARRAWLDAACRRRARARRAPSLEQRHQQVEELRLLDRLGQHRGEHRIDLAAAERRVEHERQVGPQRAQPIGRGRRRPCRACACRGSPGRTGRRARPSPAPRRRSRPSRARECPRPRSAGRGCAG